MQGFVLFGKLETGVICEKDEFVIEPLGLKTKIRAIALNKEKVDKIYAGQTAELLLTLDKSSKEEIMPTLMSTHNVTGMCNKFAGGAQ